ncbi:hypothetical protein ACI77N_21875, partial [Pseudomonas sp. S191]
MSLSVNNPSLVKIDVPSLDRNAVSASKVGGGDNTQAPSSNANITPLHNDSSRFSPNEVMIPGAALTKLFDMLEMVFKAMREMVYGKNLTPDTLTGSGQLPNGKPQVLGLPANADAVRQPNMPGAGRLLGNSETGKQANVPLNAEAGKQANVPVNAEIGKKVNVPVNAEIGKKAN